METAASKPPGYTDAEAVLLHEMFDALAAFTATADWTERLPFELSRSFVLERLGNPVRFTITLYRRFIQAKGQVEYKLRLDNHVQGTGKEKWSSADGGFFLSAGSAEKAAADIAAFKADIQPVQKRLSDDYYGTFYNA